nr:FGGY family carbohydrate kinase [Aquibacillus albus]
MEYVAIFDIGTSAVKGVLINQQAEIKGEYSVPVTTHFGENREVEQNPTEWWQAVKKIAQTWWNDLSIDPKQVSMISFSGQMEDVIPVSKNNQKHRAILYSDTRAKGEAVFLHEKFPELTKKTGNSIKPSSPIAKLLWLEKYKKNLYEDTLCFLFNAKDFIIYQLTNKFVTDPIAGATTGMMNLLERQWVWDLLEKIGIDLDKLPNLCQPEEIVGYVSAHASAETGFSESTPVLCGSGDAGASTIGAGAVKEGDSYFYIGTTGWVAVVKEQEDLESSMNGVFHLAHLPQKSTITIAPLLNVGNVHHWAVETFIGSAESDASFVAYEELINDASPGSNGVLFLPYLNGERNPISDSEARGAFWGIGPNTKKSDFTRAVIEGICFSLKQLIELLDIDESKSITLIGGGAKSASWCQILADCIGVPVRVPAESEFMPAIGAASSGFIRLGWVKDYQEFSDRFITTNDAKVYRPDDENYNLYQIMYQQYVKLYPSLTEIYR